MAGADSVRDRILDAAASVLAELGRPTPKLLSAVASRAGVSRPTIYRNVGDQRELFDALLRREIEKLVDQHVVPAMGDLRSPREDFLRISTVLIQAVRRHPVAPMLLEYHPGIFVRHVQSMVPIVVEVGEPRLAPILRAATAEGRIPEVDVRALLVWSARLAVAYLVTPNGEETDAEVRASVESLIDLAGLIPRP